MSNWDSEQYLKFIRERTQPAVDLANRIPLQQPRTILDIGCGPGNSTQVLADRFPDAQITGADNSENMIQKARSLYPSLNFILFDADSGFDALHERYDIVFSNACIQWIPDHHRLLRNMMGLLKPGGVLAIQTPMNDHEPIHAIITALAKSEKWKHRFAHPRVFHNLTQEAYFDLLSELSSDFFFWQTTYLHRMPSHESIMDWYKGTGLRPYLSALEPEEAALFEQEVYREVVQAYPKQRNGEIIFRFPRFFFTAVK